MLHCYTSRMPMATKEEQREYQRKWIAKRRSDWIEENGPCAECGSTDNLEVDHKDSSTKVVNPKMLWSLALNNPFRVGELAKCQVLCFSCHIKKTWDVDRKRATHGNSLYRKGCKCEVCRADHAIVNARYRNKK